VIALESALRRIVLELNEAHVRFALVGGLDLADLRALLRVASNTELALARDSLTLIAARGYHRGRNLLAEFDALFPPHP
jgi:hypothetical protein